MKYPFFLLLPYIFFTFLSYFAPFSAPIAIPSSNSWHSSNKSTFIDSRFSLDPLWHGMARALSSWLNSPLLLRNKFIRVVEYVLSAKKNLFWLPFPLFLLVLSEREISTEKWIRWFSIVCLTLHKLSTPCDNCWDKLDKYVFESIDRFNNNNTAQLESQ